MRDNSLLRLAQDLEWLGCELEYYGHKHAMEGYPKSGLTWNAFLQKRRGVRETADKVERELKSSIKFNPTRLVGIEYPVDSTLDSVAELLAALEDIKRCAEMSVQELPAKVRSFTRQVDNYIGADKVSVP